MLLSTLLLTPIEWQRYYLPIYPAIGLLLGLGLTRISQTLVWWQRQRFNRPTLKG
jgi:hypothetical protein